MNEKKNAISGKGGKKKAGNSGSQTGQYSFIFQESLRTTQRIAMFKRDDPFPGSFINASSFMIEDIALCSSVSWGFHCNLDAGLVEIPRCVVYSIANITNYSGPVLA